MGFDRSGDPSFFLGVLISTVAHLCGAIVVFICLENASARAFKDAEVFSVTIEGGEMLGGVGQAPKDMTKKIVTRQTEEPQQKQESQPEEKKAEPPKETVKEPEKKLEQPTVVDDNAMKLAVKKAEEEKKKIEAEKEKVQEEKEKKLQKEKEDKKKQELEDQKKEQAKERADRDKQLANLAKKFQKQYDGESADVGGKGFGAAALGGKGMGGGTLTSLEKLAYSNALQKHVKEGWHWLNSGDALQAKVLVNILPDGQVQDVRIEQSSGNRNFDDSVVRAVYKASPVPKPPEGLYNDFQQVRFSFDSRE